MGSKVKAICECGLHKEILIGGGKLTFKYKCYFPCLCEKCEDVVEVNLLNMFENPNCPNCNCDKVISYDHNDLKGIKGDSDVVSWNVRWKLGRELKLTNGTYKCPKCKEMTLKFVPLFYIWD